MDSRAEICFRLGKIYSKVGGLHNSIPDSLKSELSVITHELILLKEFVGEMNDNPFSNLNIGGLKDGNK